MRKLSWRSFLVIKTILDNNGMNIPVIYSYNIEGISEIVMRKLLLFSALDNYESLRERESERTHAILKIEKFIQLRIAN